MRAYLSMLPSEFAYQLRTIAINAGARAAVIDQIDAILDAPSEDETETRIEEAKEEAFEALYAASMNAISDRALDIGLTGTQLEQILELLETVRP